ncbi:hypothetical protein J6TS1_19990 [Siminovitchia terrae]|uniref:Uncharacterized protein n=1 Tax=Siminovitchia terrae TaxID=1914933 RepID=A0ABQ4KWX0_SIMTE|nr:hypothetical protein [Siminovitchia terrae]GIN96129.1 hypothetical protein J6TS1_19990 [Siminovitchia terrae]
MDQGKKEDLKESIKDTAADIILDVGSKAAAEVVKETVTGLLKEVLVDTGASMIPGISGAISGYKRARFERNIKQFTNELSLKVEDLRINLEQKTAEQKEQLDQLLAYILDYVIDEQQEEKIEFMVNGFVQMTEHENITEDFVLTYYDVLKELRLVDISVLRLMYTSFYMYDQANRETYIDVMEKHGISLEQYESVRRNLHRRGLLTTKTDLNINDDLDQIHKTFKELFAYLKKLTNPRFKGSLPTLREPKFKSKDNLQISKFGREFVHFFLNMDNDEMTGQ